jgi:hypothetical protein
LFRAFAKQTPPKDLHVGKLAMPEGLSVLGMDLPPPSQSIDAMNCADNG